MNKKHGQNPKRYLGTPRRKDYYKFIYDSFKKNNIKKVFDIGTASGDFLFFMPSTINGIGIDQSNILINQAKKTRKKKNLKYQTADILNPKSIKIVVKKYGKPDAVCLFGTLTVFRNPLEILDIIFKLKPKIIYINDWFNIHPVDINCGYRLANQKDLRYNYCWNILSKQTIIKYLNKKKVSFKFLPYKMKTKLKQGPNPLFSWHSNLGKEEIITNGLGLILRGYNLLAYLKT